MRVIDLYLRSIRAVFVSQDSLETRAHMGGLWWKLVGPLITTLGASTECLSLVNLDLKGDMALVAQWMTWAS